MRPPIIPRNIGKRYHALLRDLYSSAIVVTKSLYPHYLDLYPIHII
jgi:hypothetical protein